ncbi:acyl-CoA dehydrogenase family protein [Streptomyces radicis]|uniref:Acyl-CoA dehydrogenase n=1 Tax=Streptomyces radicis TaxID=1750517 RepID=A0A3A9WJ65_9ACTN|nr:acyl-CoA dehydrogenase family protein [Streptomyces radicis]RKN12860.1 acyl-CoA dehydrogenase [Streptomyces radicis]RKN27375.1 acyl-CoA dehydrogenase [Streptomyces radicis]
MTPAATFSATPSSDVDEAALRAGPRAFVDAELAPRADAFDEAAEIPEWFLTSLAEQGMWGAVRTGGMVAFGVLHEEVGRGCSSARSLLTVHSMALYALDRWGSAAMRERWLDPMTEGGRLGAFCLTEPGAGSDITAVAATARPAPGGGWLLDGHKKWVTGGERADLLLVFARTERGVSAFLVPADTPGLTRTPVRGLLGTRAALTAEIRFDGCRLPAEALLGAEGMGTAIAAGVLDIGRYSVASGSVGIVQACLDASVHHATTRRQGGVLIGRHQLIQKMITEMAVNLRAARALCLRAGRLKEAGDPATIVETCAAKYLASVSAMRAATDAVQIHGASGCSAERSVARYFRDAKIMEIIEGSSQIQEVLIAQHALTAAGGARPAARAGAPAAPEGSTA